MDELSLGKYLRLGREKMELTIEDVSLHTNISKKMLRAMENDSWHEFPSEIFLKNYLKKYTEFVGLDYNEAQLMYIEQIKNSFLLRNTFGYGTKWFIRPSAFQIRPLTAILMAVLLVLGAYYLWLLK